MSEMIERVAERIVAAIKAQPEPWPGEGGIYRIIARVAIEEMREPTEAMVDAGHDEAPMCEFGVPLTKPCREFNREAYRAMIQAALTPPTDAASPAQPLPTAPASG